MKKIIDLQTFQKITTDCMRVHETVRSTEPLTAEAERILELADSLLREAGLAYLNEGQNLDLPSLPNSEQATPPEEVVENFIGVQNALADLKQALYQLVKIQVAEQKWPEIETSFKALVTLGENGSDVPSLVKDIENTFIQLMQTQVAEQRWPELATSFNALVSLGEKVVDVSSMVNAIDSSIVEAVEDTFIPQAKDLFKSKEWDNGRALLKPWLFSWKVRSCYYTSYVDQSYALAKTHPLVELESQVPTAGIWELDYSIEANSSLDSEFRSKILSKLNPIVTNKKFKPRSSL